MSVFRSLLSWFGSAATTRNGDQQEQDDESLPPPSLPTGSDQHHQGTPSGVDGGQRKEPVTTRVPGETPCGFVRGSKNLTSDVDEVVTSSKSSAPPGLSSSLQESKISTSTVQDRKSSSASSGSVSDKKSSSTASGSVSDRKSSSTTSGSVPKKRSTIMPSGSVPDRKFSSTPSVFAHVKRLSSTSSASGPKKKSSSTPSGSVPDRKSSNTTSGSVPKKKSTSMPSGSVPDRKSPITPSGSVPVKRPSSTPSGSVPVKKSSSTPSGSVPQEHFSGMPSGSVTVKRPSITPSGSVPVKISSSTPSGSVPHKKSSGMPSGSVPVKRPSSTPSGSVSVERPSSKPAGSVPEEKSSAPGGSKNDASHHRDRDPHLGGSNTDGKTHRKRPRDPPYAADINPKLPRTDTREAQEIHALSRAATSGHSRNSATLPSPEERAVRTTAASAATTVNTRPVAGDLRALTPATDTSETPGTDRGARPEIPAQIIIDVSDDSDSDTELSPEAPSVSAPPATAMPDLRRPDHGNLSSATATNMTARTSAGDLRALTPATDTSETPGTELSPEAPSVSAPPATAMPDLRRPDHGNLSSAAATNMTARTSALGAELLEQSIADMAARAVRAMYMQMAPGRESVSDTYGIPAAPVHPVRERILDLDNVTEVFFDIKTSGLQQGQKITQIAAIRADGGNINCSVLSDVPQVGPQSAGLWQGAQQVSDGRSSHDLSLKSALENLCNFLAQRQNNVLVGHNIRTVRSNALFCALEDCGLLSRFCSQVKGFVDTMKLFKQTHRHLQTHGLQELVRNILGIEYNAHDAMAAAHALQQLMRAAGITPDIKRDASYSIRYTMDRFLESQRAKQTLASFDVLVSFRHKVLSPSIATKIAGSGLTVQHLEKVYRKGGRKGLKEVFSEQVEGKARVSVQAQTINAIAKYFDRTSLPGHSSATAVSSTSTGHT